MLICRLYYLYRGPKMAHIQEEKLMRILYWLSPITAGFFTTLHMVENILYNNSYLFHYSYCGKTSFSSNIVYNLIIGNSCMILTTLSITCELLAHMVIYVKQTKIENRAQVYEIRGNHLVCQQRHQRNVVSALGHFCTFAISMTHRIIFAISLYFFEDDTIVRFSRLLFFLLPCIHFCLHPLIETISSHNLRGTLFTLNYML